MGQEGISEVGLADFPGIILPQASVKLAIVYKTSSLFMTAATLTVWHTAVFPQLTLFIVPRGGMFLLWLIEVAEKCFY